MQWLVTILIAVLRAVLPSLIREAKPTADDARLQPELRERLRRRIRQTWLPTVFWLAVGLSLVSAGCTRTVYVPHGEPVRLRETVPDVKVWVMGPDGKPFAGKMDLPEGWYALPVEPEE